jgi:hypothetical protein
VPTSIDWRQHCVNFMLDSARRASDEEAKALPVVVDGVMLEIAAVRPGLPTQGHLT